MYVENICNLYCACVSTKTVIIRWVPIRIRLHWRWWFSLEKWCWEFLLYPVSQCKTGDNVSTVRINPPQLRAEIKAICESGTTWHQCVAMAQLEQHHCVYLKIIQNLSMLGDCFAHKCMTSRGYFETLNTCIFEKPHYCHFKAQILSNRIYLSNAADKLHSPAHLNHTMVERNINKTSAYLNYKGLS